MDNELTFSDAFLDMAYKAIIHNACHTEAEQRQLSIMSDVCAKYDLSFNKFIQAINEITERMKEADDE